MRNRRATPRSTLAAIARSLIAITTFVAPWSAQAGNMDPVPERLVLQPPGLPAGQTCQSIAANPNVAVAAGLSPQSLACRANNAAFANMISELGFAMAPSAMYPARSTGIGGFQVSVEASYTKISADRAVQAADGQQTQYWHLGTRGPQDKNTQQNSIINTSPDSILQIYSVKARKGLPLGFEIAGSLGYMAGSTLWVGGGDLRWAILEGFRTGALGLLPDVSIGGGVRSVTGTSRFYLTTVGLDVKLSKTVPLADSAMLIPTVGYQRLLIFGDSNVLDATPNVDAQAQCGVDGSDPVSGTPRCRNKLANGADANTDFANAFTFEKVRIHRNRVLLGMNYRYELVWLGSQLAVDINLPKDEQSILVGGRQWTLSFEGGVYF